MTTRVRRRCGEVEIELSSEPLVQFYCHCDDCQAVHGAAYAPESVYPSDAVTVVRFGPKAWTLKRNPRFSWGQCGTRLFIDARPLGVRGLNGRPVLPRVRDEGAGWFGVRRLTACVLILLVLCSIKKAGACAHPSADRSASEAGKKCFRNGGLLREHCQSPATTLWRTQAILKYSPSLGPIAVFAIIS